MPPAGWTSGTKDWPKRAARAARAAGRAAIAALRVGGVLVATGHEPAPREGAAA